MSVSYVLISLSPLLQMCCKPILIIIKYIFLCIFIVYLLYISLYVSLYIYYIRNILCIIIILYDFCVTYSTVLYCILLYYTITCLLSCIMCIYYV